ncbi:MAG: 2-C-methyl-D-erythritol 4-phosphate cytidylyltransferase [Actinomycetota bacterium]
MSVKTLFVLIVGSDLASQLLNGISLHQLALDEAISFSKANNAEFIEVRREELLDTLKRKEFDLVVIHDELLPLVSINQMQRTYEQIGDFAAIRPTMAFTETIKSLDSDHRLNQTIDREKVRRISSPEVIKKSAIDFDGELTTWSVPLNTGVKTSQIESDPAGIRVNNLPEIKMLAALAQLADPAQK